MQTCTIKINRTINLGQSLKSYDIIHEHQFIDFYNYYYCSWRIAIPCKKPMDS